MYNANTEVLDRSSPTDYFSIQLSAVPIVTSIDQGSHFVIPYGRSGASARVRVYEWIEKTHIAATVHNFLGNEAAGPRQVLTHLIKATLALHSLSKLERSGMSTLLLHREASPLTDGGLESRLMGTAGLAVYDFDDALYCNFGRGLRSLRPKAPKVIRALAAADRVIAGNETLADFAANFANDVRVIPSCVEPAAYTQKWTHDLHDPPRIGWLGSPSGEPYLNLAAAAVKELHHRSGARLVIMGAMRPTLGSLEPFIDRIQWSERNALQFGNLCDVGIMPLEDGIYERGKCGYKLLQYGAMALPFVASPVGINANILDKAGMPAARQQDDWIGAISAMLELATHDRAACGARAKAFVERDYSFDIWRTRWLEALGL